MVHWTSEVRPDIQFSHISACLLAFLPHAVSSRNGGNSAGNIGNMCTNAEEDLCLTEISDWWDIMLEKEAGQGKERCFVGPCAILLSY